MTFGWSDFEKIDTEALARIERDSIAESATLEYKGAAFDLGGDSAKKDLANAVAAMANTHGGCILLGIDETGRQWGGAVEGDDPAPSRYRATGLEVGDEDHFKLQVLQCVSGRTTPRLHRFEIKFVAVPSGGPKKVVVIGVPRSWAAPHATGPADAPRFYHRTGPRSAPMDVAALRQAILQSEDLPTVVRRRLDARLGQILSEDGPVPPGLPPVFALVQFAGTSPEVQIDVDAIANDPRFRQMAGGYPRPTMEGVLSAYVRRDLPLGGFAHLYRDGSLDLMIELQVNEARSGIRWLVDRYLLDPLIKNIRIYESLMVQNGGAAPIVGRSVISGVAGASISTGNVANDHDPERIYQSMLILPEVVVERFAEIERALKVWLDALWRAGGHREFPHDLDAEGRLPIGRA